MYKRKTYYSIVLLWSFIFSEAQVFSWNNPNNKKNISKDSTLTKKLNKQIFSKDTTLFIQKEKKILYDEGILIKKHFKSQSFNNLLSKGNITRGISFGNKHGESVQSSMNLEISGNINKDIELSAIISDTNLPLQADGYTQTLREFDKIYMLIKIKEKHHIESGYINLEEQDTRFSKYQKQSMGLQYSTSWQNKTHKGEFSFSSGISRSNFHRMRFQGNDGNQGPYRLYGVNGENFIVIINNSERVYIDGVLMKRGEEHDYTINYNTGEITFTSKRPILNQNFITISYNYTNRNYIRYLLTGHIKYETPKWKTSFNAFVENDDKNSPLSFNLSENEKSILQNSKNNEELIYAESEIPTNFSPNTILYKKLFSAGKPYYEVSSNQKEQLYLVSFTYTGEKKGDYRLKNNLQNGNIYEFVGENNGNYKAVKKLTAPEATRVFTAITEYQLNKGKIGTEISLSNKMFNLFSTTKNQNNTGYAGRIWGNKQFSQNNWNSLINIDMQRINRNFHVLDRINNVEFARDFNLDQEFSKISQNRLIFSINNQWLKKYFIDYQLNLIEETSHYKGIKHEFNSSITKEKRKTNIDFSYLKTNTVYQNTEFIRGNAVSQYYTSGGIWKGGVSMEHNLKKIHLQNTIDKSSFAWKEIFLQKSITDSLKTKLMARIYWRENDSIRNNKLQKINHILGISGESNMIKTEKNTLNFHLHYRKFFNHHHSKKDNQNFIMISLNSNHTLFNNGLVTNSLYEIGNGQEAQRNFQYIKVPDGNGIYKWTDYNHDKVQQIDEFEIAEYRDLANYIRVYGDKIQYLPSNNTKMRVSLLLKPYLIFNSKNNFVKRWSMNSLFFTENSFAKEDKNWVLNPFYENENELFRNKNSLFSIDFDTTEISAWYGSYQWNESQNILNANQNKEKRSHNSHSIRLGYQFPFYNAKIDLESKILTLKNNSQLFSSQSYKISERFIRPKFIYKISEKINTEIWTLFRNKERTDGNEHLKAYEITGNLIYEKAKIVLKTHFSFIHNNFYGNSYSPVGNQMLEGLKPGKNQVWNITIQRNINKFIFLNLNYEGRNSKENTIHTGSMQIMAKF